MKYSVVLLLCGSVAVVACATSAVDPTVDDDSGILPKVDSGKDAFVPFKDAAVADTNQPLDSSAADVIAEDSSLAEGGVDSGPDASIVDSGLSAVVQINEVNPNINLQSDLVELYVVTSGDTKGITIEENITGKVVLATLPSIAVMTGDLIVVHLNPANGIKDESSTKTDCADAACYSGAWDVRGSLNGITYSGRVLLARDPNSNIQDGVAFFKKGSVSPALFHKDVTSLQAANQWLPADCGGFVCSTNALAEGISVDWNGSGTIPSSNSAARAANVDTNKAGDWAVGAQSFGASNP